jgi:hypothetical protein
MRRLLAGYATGTLTDGERKALLEASLTDPELFEAIAEEEPLRALLTDPAARAEILSRIEPAPVAFREKFAAWLRRPPIAAAFATVAVAVVVVSVVPLLRVNQQEQQVQSARMVMQPPVPRIVRAPEQPEPVDELRDAAKTPPRERAVRQKLEQQAGEPPTARRDATSEMKESPPTAAAAPASPPPAAPRAVEEARVVAQDRAEGPPAAGQAGSQLQGGSQSQAVVVTSEQLVQQAAAPPPPSPKALARLTASKASADRATEPPRVTVLRKTGAGIYAAADPLKTVFASGDMVRVRVESRESGLVNIHGATAQPITGSVAPGRAFETADIRIGDQDLQLMVSFTLHQALMRSMANSLRSPEPVVPPSEITLRVKKP